jgi:hypothetical protein
MEQSEEWELVVETNMLGENLSRSLRPPQTPHDLAWDQTRSATVRSERLTSWAVWTDKPSGRDDVTGDAYERLWRRGTDSGAQRRGSVAFNNGEAAERRDVVVSIPDWNSRGFVMDFVVSLSLSRQIRGQYPGLRTAAASLLPESIIYCRTIQRYDYIYTFGRVVVVNRSM